MTTSINLEIKLYHLQGCTEQQLRANANAFARVLSPLPHPWVIKRTGAHELTAYCTTGKGDAVALPTFTDVTDVRFESGPSRIESGEVLIRSM
jgi:hypothetical protein